MHVPPIVTLLIAPIVTRCAGWLRACVQSAGALSASALAAGALSICGLSLCGAAIASAQTPPAAPIADLVGRPVARVSIDRVGRPLDDPRYVALLETIVGEPLSSGDVRDSIRHLFYTGLFEDISVDAQPDGAGVALTYRVTPVRTVSRYAFTGDLGLSDGALRDALDERYGQRPTVNRVSDAAGVLERFYRERGYLDPHVAVAVQPDAAETAILVFTIQSGPAATLGRVDVRGASLEPPAQLLADLDLAPGRRYEPQTLNARIIRLVTRLRNRGYYEAAVAPLPTPRDEGRVVDLTIDVQTGPRITVRFEGDPIPEAQREELVPVRREGTVDEDLLEDSKRRIEAYLARQGHWKAQVAYARRQPSPDELEIVFTIRAGQIFKIAEVAVAGAQALTEADVRKIIGVERGDVYVASSLDGNTNALVDRYHRLGYRLVKVDQLVEPLDQPPPAEKDRQAGWVRVRFEVTERTRTTVTSVTIAGNASVPDAELRARLTLRPGEPFYEPQVATDRNALESQYLNRGFERVQIVATSTFRDDPTKADLVFTVTEGAQLSIDRIIIVGNRRTDAATIEKALTIQPGRPLGLEDVLESQRRLSALGLFRRVRISEMGESGDTTRDVLVAVEEAPPTTIGYGAGVEAGSRLRQDPNNPDEARERVELAGRGFFEVSRRNLFGANRSATLFTRASVRPRDDPDDPSRDGTGLAISEYRVLATIRDPAVLGWRIDGQVSGYFEQAIRSSFSFRRRGMQTEFARRLGRGLSLVGAYSLNATELFNERIDEEDRLDIDRLFPQVRLSIFTVAVRRDTRDDPLDPTRGSVLGLDSYVAGRAVGSEVGFMKGFGEAFVYRQLPQLRGAVLAGGLRVGLARGFPRDVTRVNENGEVVVDPNGEPIVDTITDLPASERFFAGGDTTVRGFARDTLGDVGTLDRRGFPTGGNALIVLNGELRVPVWRDFGGVLFVDAGNVFSRASQLDLGKLRPSAGFGVRYKSPIGPIRVDLGFKLNRLDNLRESKTEIHISLGQAF